jgi:hypothetical protein
MLRGADDGDAWLTITIVFWGTLLLIGIRLDWPGCNDVDTAPHANSSGQRPLNLRGASMEIVRKASVKTLSNSVVQ